MAKPDSDVRNSNDGFEKCTTSKEKVFEEVLIAAVDNTKYVLNLNLKY